jgi:acid phosphatase family membrane protein YuiD
MGDEEVMHRRLKLALAAIVVLAAAVVAWAAWSPAGAGEGSGTVGTLNAAAISVPPTSPGSHQVTWTQQASLSNPTFSSQIKYTVTRKTEPVGDYTPIVSGACSGALDHPTTSCTDTAATGSYRYQVLAKYKGWTAISAPTTPVVVTVVPLDTTPPTVSSIVRAGPNETTNASSVDFTVTFSENVNGVDATDFVTTGTAPGSVVSTVSPSSGPGTAYTVSVNTGTGDGTVGLRLVDNDTVVDTATPANKLGGEGTSGGGDGSFTSTQTYTMDKTAPSVVSIKRPVGAGGLTNGASVSWIVKFTESVSHVSTGDFTLTASGITGAQVDDVDPLSGPNHTYTVTANAGTGDGTLRLDLADDDSIEDAADNVLGGPGDNGDFTTGETYTFDRTGPTVQSITRADANPTNAATVRWTVMFDDASVQGVDDTGPNEGSDFALVASGVTGAQITDVHAVSGSTYTITATTGNGDGTLRLDVADNDSITDQLGNPLAGPGVSTIPGLAGVYTIDKTAPVVQSITRDGTSPTNAGSVSWTVTFSKSVSSVGPDDFQLVVTGLTGGPGITTVAPAAGPSASYTVTASTGTGLGTLNLNVVDDDTIVDGASNKLGTSGLGNGAFTGPNAAKYDVDRLAPQLQTLEMRDSNANGLVDRVVATFDDTIATPTNGDPWTLANVPSGGTKGTLSVTTPSTVTLLIAEGAGAKDTSVDDFTVALAADSNGIRDSFGNQASFEARAPDDKAGPVVASINRSGATPTNASSVQFNVTFSESVSPVVAGDFVRTGTHSTSNTPGAPSGSGASYTVSVNTSSGGGTLGLNLNDTNNTIKDTAANNTIAANTFTGELYTIDKTAPSVQAITRLDGSSSNASSVRWSVTFNESVLPVTADDFVLTGTVIGASIISVTGSGTTYTVEASTGGTTPGATLRLDLNDANSSIKDAAGNSLSDTTVNGEQYTIDKVVPTLTTLVMSDLDLDGKVDRVRATFSETLATYTAGTVPWTLTDVPSNGVLSSVGSPSGAVRDLIITEGPAAADTSVGSFKVVLATNAAGVRDAAGNQASFTATAPADAAAPARTRMEMFDANGNGKVDKVEIDFSEQLATYTAGNTPWNLSSEPSSGSLNNVSAGAASATLNLNEGGNAPSTAVGSFEIELATHAGGIRDAADNRTSFTGAVPVDKAAPVRTLIEALDASPTSGTARDGKIDQVRVTFSENLASSTNTSVWAFSGAVPSNGSLTSVSTAGTAATLTVTPESGSAPDTAVGGTWQIALSADATGIRDSAGNTAQFSAVAPADEASPVVTDFTDTNGANDGKFEAGNTAILTFSENVTNTASPATTTVRIDGGSNASTNDRLRAQNFLQGTTTYSLGRTDYVSGDVNADFASSTLDQPAGSPNQVRLTLAACSAGSTICNAVTDAAGLGGVEVTPSTTIRDAAANTALPNSDKPTFSIELF